MEELPLDFLEELERTPQTKTKKKSKNLERTHRTWFYEIPTHLGVCDNEDCLDDRKKPQVMVWSDPKTGLNMCRFCWLAEWLKDE